jgi:inner membrane protein
MLVTSGVAADLDFASYLGGPLAFLRFHRAVLHSLPGSIVMCCLVAGAFCFVDRSGGKDGPEPGVAKLRFDSALLACIVGASAHMVLDLASGIGVRLLWPFSGSWKSWDLLPNFDLWILLLLVAGLSLPHLGRLVSDEIGERKRGTPGRAAAIMTLILFTVYIGMREMLHSRTVDLLVSRDYHGQPPQKSGAFPTGSNPFAWRGLVATNGAIDEMDISLLPGATFDPERALTHYKPEESPAIMAAQNTSGGRLFLTYARFPFVAVEPRDTGVEVILRDLRFPVDDTSMDDVMLDVGLDENSQVIRQEMRFVGGSRHR